MRNMLHDKKNQRVLIFSILACLLAVMFFSAVLPTAFAKEPNFAKGANWEKEWKVALDNLSAQNSFLGTAWRVATAANGSSPDFSLMSLGVAIYKFPTGSFADKITGFTAGSGGFINAGKAMYNSMKVIGMALVILFFLIELLDEVQADNFNYEHLIKKLITLAVGLVVGNKGGDIFASIANWGNDMLYVAEESAKAGLAASGENEAIYTTLMAAGNHGGLFSGIMAVLEALSVICDNILPFLLYCVALIVAYIVSFSRFIEILVRYAFAPIGLAPIVSGGAKSSGMRYAKKFASVCLQGAVCILAIGASQIVLSLQSEIGGIFAKVLVPLTLIGFLLKTGRVADDICGV